jgi:hypothetical protein
MLKMQQTIIAQPNIIISRASSPEYCNTSSLEQGSSSGVEGNGSDEEHEEVCEVEEESGNDRGILTDADRSIDDHVRCCCCIRL